MQQKSAPNGPQRIIPASHADKTNKEFNQKKTDPKDCNKNDLKYAKIKRGNLCLFFLVAKRYLEESPLEKKFWIGIATTTRLCFYFCFLFL